MKINIINLSNTKPAIFFKGENLKNTESISLKIKPDEFVKSTGSLDIARLNDLGISHFRLINSNSVRGVTLANQKEEILKELKRCGINTVIDLRSEGDTNSKYAKNCRENGLDFLNFKLKINMPIFNVPLATKLSTNERQKQNQNFIKQLPNFFEKMNQGRCYMACMLGLHRTDLAVTLNYLINPIEPSTPPTLSHMFDKKETNFTNKYIGAMKNLLKNLSNSDKEFLGLPNNFKEIFDVRILKLRMMNGVKP